jgi:phthalate 4,5-dioxygenase reductase component
LLNSKNPTSPTHEVVQAATMELNLFNVRVAKVVQQATDITMMVLESIDQSPLPDFEPGSHITVKTPLGALRQYSLCGRPCGTGVWQIAVKREARGRGGSLSMVDGIKAGQLLTVSLPSNNFVLEPSAKQYLFIAGGIGITPILAMLYGLVDQSDFDPKRIKLVYLCRDLASAAFVKELQTLLPASSLLIHFDDGNSAAQYDLWETFEKPNQSYVYCCGPAPLMDAVRDMTGHWAKKQIHFESFGVGTATKATDETFQVCIASTGQVLDIEPSISILQVLRDNGLKVASSCESGTCGTCKTGLLAGEADHRDLVLIDEEKNHFVMICVSRAISASLTLDI